MSDSDTGKSISRMQIRPTRKLTVKRLDSLRDVEQEYFSHRQAVDRERDVTLVETRDLAHETSEQTQYLREQVDDLKAEVKRLSLGGVRHSDDPEKLKEQLKSHQTEIAFLLQCRAELEHAVSAVQRRYDEAESEIRFLKQEGEKEICRLTERCARSDEMIVQLESQCGEKAAVLEKLEARLRPADELLPLTERLRLFIESMTGPGLPIEQLVSLACPDSLGRLQRMVVLVESYMNIALPHTMGEEYDDLRQVLSENAFNASQVVQALPGHSPHSIVALLSEGVLLLVRLTVTSGAMVGYERLSDSDVRTILSDTGKERQEATVRLTERLFNCLRTHYLCEKPPGYTH